ncbi:MAG: hypothetical protein IPM35_10755 [Myxococcales bacterium]|nr:hypothetical protein [Myxococcales bacterium]
MTNHRILAVLLVALGALSCGEESSESGSTTGGAGGSAGASGGSAGASGAGGSAGSDAGKTTETLAHHDGQPPVAAFSPWMQSATDRAEVAIRFTPPSYPTTLKSVRLYTENPSGADVPFDVRVYADDAGSPKTSEVLAAATPKPVASSSLDGWLDIDMPKTSLAAGSFWVAIQWDPAPLAADNGKTSFYTTCDSALDHPDAHVVYVTDKWLTFTQAGLPVADLLVEAVIEH